jgi:hypothetical protein
MDGKVVLLEPAPASEPVKVIVMFPEEEPVENNDKPFLFSWQKPDFQPFEGTLSDAVIDERRSE